MGANGYVDRTTIGVYADYLDETGEEPQLTELIRLQQHRPDRMQRIRELQIQLGINPEHQIQVTRPNMMRNSYPLSLATLSEPFGSWYSRIELSSAFIDDERVMRVWDHNPIYHCTIRGVRTNVFDFGNGRIRRCSHVHLVLVGLGIGLNSLLGKLLSVKPWNCEELTIQVDQFDYDALVPVPTTLDVKHLHYFERRLKSKWSELRCVLSPNNVQSVTQ